MFLKKDFTNEPYHGKPAIISFEKNKGADGFRYPAG